MKLLLVSFCSILYEGRLRELIKVSKSIGETVYVTSEECNAVKVENKHIIYKKYGFFCYLRFIIYCIFVAKKEKPDIVIAYDRLGIMPTIIIKYLFKIKLLIYDAPEMYIMKDIKHFNGIVGCLVEKLFLKEFDLSICASEYRSVIMQKYFKLNYKPLVFENIRKLNFVDDYDKYIKKYDGFFDNQVRIVSTSGCSVSRTNDLLVDAICKLGKGFVLYLVGNSSEDDIKKIQKIIKIHKVDNVKILGQLNESELKYLLSNCHIGVVNYNKIGINNIYCASGKIYEFMCEGLPVVTTTNPPLFDMCDQFKIGVASDDYVYSIKTVNDNYGYYKKNVTEYLKNYDFNLNNKRLIDQISLYIANMQ